MNVVINKYWSFILGFLMLHATSTEAQTVSARVDSSKVQVGQLIRLMIDVEVTEGSTVLWPRWDEQLLGGLDLVEVKAVDTNLSEKRIQLHQEIHLISFDTGQYPLPPIPLVIANRDKKADSLYGNQTILIEVSLAPVDTSKAFMDIYPPVQVPFDWKEYIPWLIGLILLIALLYFAYRYWKKRKNQLKEPPAEPEVVLSPAQKALASLRKLRDSDYLKNGEDELYQALITDTLRLYIQEHWYFQAVEMSRFEILFKMQMYQLPAHERQRLKTILNTADLVKFAKVQLSPTEHEKVLDDAIQWVEKTANSSKIIIQANDDV